ncbi:MAG TPA: addiction module toxin, HicA family [Candidatus Aminicenantes bacterium]|nr:addiction module toxin, HicA family [Candidatus Aminicenantes bacterium]
MISLLKKFGFVVIRTRGSHQFLRHVDGRCTVVPVHRGETIGKGLLSRILRDCELTVADLQSHL